MIKTNTKTIKIFDSEVPEPIFAILIRFWSKTSINNFYCFGAFFKCAIANL